MSAVLATLSGSYPPLRGRSPTCYSAVRHCTPKCAVRLACFRHAASVYPEPGSNSPSELSESILPYRTNGFSNDLSTDRHAPHHSSIVNVPRTPSAWLARHNCGAERHLTNPAPGLSRPFRASVEIRFAGPWRFSRRALLQGFDSALGAPRQYAPWCSVTATYPV